ncbi:MAG: NAD(+)/NADH kinase [Mucinivorans sp.]
MKIALYVRSDNVHQSFFEELLRRRALSYELNPRDTTQCTHAISLGGDGTFLSAVRTMGASQRLPLMGVNTGRLGFLATVSLAQVDQALDSIERSTYRTEQRAMIDVSNIANCINTRATALNEFSIQKSGTSMIHIHMTVDGVLAASYWADGVIVSTPTGSTAYSMSVSGPILTPECRCFVVSPIAPHNLSIRPLVVGDGAMLGITVTSRTNADSISTLDNKEYKAASGSSYTITKSADCQEVISLQDNNFYDTIREKLLWGVDLRN